jgi:hypothetical protein
MMMRKLTKLLLVVSVAVLLNGCGAGTSDQTAAPSDVGHAHDHEGESGGAHPTEGPHGGHLIELGEEQYHAELCHDGQRHEVTIHLLDAAAQAPITIDQNEIKLSVFKDGQFVEYALKAASEGEGGSQFRIVDEELCDLLTHAHELRGRLHVTIQGEQYTGMIEHHAHEHNGHSHGDEGRSHEDQGHAHEDDDHRHDDQTEHSHKETSSHFAVTVIS